MFFSLPRNLSFLTSCRCCNSPDYGTRRAQHPVQESQHSLLNAITHKHSVNSTPGFAHILTMLCAVNPPSGQQRPAQVLRCCFSGCRRRFMPCRRRRRCCCCFRYRHSCGLLVRGDCGTGCDYWSKYKPGFAGIVCVRREEEGVRCTVGKEEQPSISSTGIPIRKFTLPQLIEL